MEQEQADIKRRKGRPIGAKSGIRDEKMVTLTMRVKRKHLKVLDYIADRQGYDFNRHDLIRMAIVDYIKAHSDIDAKLSEEELSGLLGIDFGNSRIANKQEGCAGVENFLKDDEL